MEEKRKHKRYNIRMNLAVTGLFSQDKDFIDIFKPDLEVINMSKSGLGFFTDVELPTNYYFNANVVLDQDKHFFTVIKIVRKKLNDGIFYYGCEFVGLADIVSTSIDEFVEEDSIE